MFWLQSPADDAATVHSVSSTLKPHVRQTCFVLVFLLCVECYQMFSCKTLHAPELAICSSDLALTLI